MHTDTDFIKEQSRCIAHEIRNQLSIVDVYSEIVKKHLQKSGIENPSIDSALVCIQKSAKMINNSLMDLKSLNNLEPKEADLKDLILQGVDMAKVYIHEKDIKIKPLINDSAIALIDENKFLACMINILKNAVEAIEVTGIINVSMDVFKDYAAVKISNNGSKIPNEKINEIFNEGFTTKKTGSGLGLYICSNNLKAQGMNLKLNRSDENLTEFEITIPIKIC